MLITAYLCEQRKTLISRPVNVMQKSNGLNSHCRKGTNLILEKIVSKNAF